MLIHCDRRATTKTGRSARRRVPIWVLRATSAHKVSSSRNALSRSETRIADSEGERRQYSAAIQTIEW